ncbi:MAG: dihydroorotate dehydrogenase-like protein [Gemmataceae bacterium]
MDLSTTYMGFELPHPLVPGASPMSDDLSVVRQLEDSGAPMIVMHSLFEEQIISEQLAVTSALDSPTDSFAEALSYFPHPEEFLLGPEEYLDQVRRIKEAVDIPVIGSLNGTREGTWTVYAKYIEEAGADGLELNLYDVTTNLEEDGTEVEHRELRVVQAVREAVKIPIAVKLSPFYSSIANFAKQLDALNVDALVLFNRFYQPDIDTEQLELIRVNLSSPAELLLRLRWLGILSGRINASLAASGGVHSAVDAVKAVMTGAHSVQIVSALLRNGPTFLRDVLQSLRQWLEVHEYESLRQMQGSMNLLRCANPHAYERANYVKVLQSWQS